MNGITVGRKRGDHKTVLFNGSNELVKLCFIVKKNFGITVSLAGEAAATDFDSGTALLAEIFASLFKREVSKKITENA
jgi:hypothetical protein